MKQWAVAVVLAMAAVSAFPSNTMAQLEAEGQIFSRQDMFAVGLQAGLLSGSGVAVRYHPVGRFGFQVVGGGITIDKRFISSVGAEVQFDFDYEGRSRFYGFVGAGYYSNGYDAPKPGDEEERLAAPFRLGAGVSYEFEIAKKIVFTPTLGFTWFARDGAFWPLPQLGMHYYFN